MGLTRRGRCTHGTDTHPLGASSNHRTQTNRILTNSQITRKAKYDLERLEHREINRLAEELVPRTRVGGCPGGCWCWAVREEVCSLQCRAATSRVLLRAYPDDPIDPLTGTADVIGTFAGE